MHDPQTQTKQTVPENFIMTKYSSSRKSKRKIIPCGYFITTSYKMSYGNVSITLKGK